MKDPLQAEVTPYEILGVPRDASSDVVERGFREGLVQRQSVPKLTAAKRALQDPVERAVVDAFLYEPGFLSQMLPNPAADPAALQARREQTGQVWAQTLGLRFPDLGALHCCSVLWYWSAVAATDPGQSTKNWVHAIGGWTSLLASDGFRTHLGPQADAAAARIEERLRGTLRDRQQAETEAGRADEAEAYRELELEFEAELRSARRVAAAGLRLDHGTLSSGPLLLELLNLNDFVRRHLDAALRENPAQASLVAVRASLFSPVARVDSLIEANDPEQAIAVIEGLPEKDRGAPEAQHALVRALHALGRRHADLEKTTDALAAWVKALRIDTGDLTEKIEAEVTAMCLSRAAAWQASRRDDAIAVLEQGLQVVRNLKMQQTLAELIAQRGVDRVNEALRAADFEHKGYSPALAGPLRAGLADLESAARLGSDRAEEQARQVRSIKARGVWTQRKTRSIEVNSLPPAARRRFAQCAAGQAKPVPLILERIGGAAGGSLAIALACAVGTLLTVRAGFGEAIGAYHGVGAIVWYSALVFGFFAGTLNVVKAQVERRLRPYAAGRYLFPLDVVDAREGTLQVHPTSDIEKFEPIHHHTAGTYTHTVFTFEFKDKARLQFHASPRARADEILKGLQTASDAAQEALKTGDLTALRDLDLFPGASS
jgi:hypothetical protein